MSATRDAGRWQTQHFLVTEYVDGLDIGEIVARLATIRVADACEIARRVALALECAHRHNLVHRDIKPKNILLGQCPPEGEVQVKLVDLGLAALRAPPVSWDADAGNRLIVGTLSFMAPEQYWEKTADIRSDIYGLGCTLYCFLVGNPPFSGRQFRDPGEIMAEHRDKPVPLVRPLRPDVPEKLEKILLTMMAKNPCDRYREPREVAQSLADFTAGHDLAELLRQALAAPVGLIAGIGDTSPVPATSETPPSSSSLGSFVLAETAPFAHPSPVKEEVLVVVPEPPLPPDHAATPEPPADAPARHDAGIAGRFPAAVLAAILAAVIVVLAGGLIALSRGGLFSPSSKNLLESVNPQRDSLSGGWEFQGKALRSADRPFARLLLPPSIPEQYLLELTAERVSGGMLVVGLVWQGRQTPVMLDGPSVTTGAAAKEAVNQGSIPAGFKLPPPSPHTYVCLVRREGVLVAYEGHPQLLCLAPDSLPSCDPAWLTPGRSRLFLGAHYSVYLFTTVRLTPLTR